MTSTEMRAQIAATALEAAKLRAESIRQGVTSVAEDYARAVIEEDWRVLGYDSQQAWHEGEFGGLRLSIEVRKQVARLLALEGQSQKEIAAATGASEATVSRDLHPEINPFEHVKPSRDVTRRRPKAAQSPAERKAAQRTRQRQEKETADKAPDPVAPAVPTFGELAGAVPDPVASDAALLAAEAKAERLEAEVARLERENLALVAARDQLQADNEQLQEKVAERQSWYEEAAARVEQLEAENIRLRSQIEPAKPAIPDPWQDVKVPGMLPPLEPRPWTAAADGPWEDFADIMRLGEPAPDPAPDPARGPVTGPCARPGCGNPGRPVLVDGTDDGRFCCDPCFAELSADRPGALSRPLTRLPGCLWR